MQSPGNTAAGPAGRAAAAVRAAFPHTLPVLMGFSCLGLTYGVLMASKGYGALWSLLMSALAFGGSMQYVAISLLTVAFDPLQAFLMSLMVNARHLFYGLSMLPRYRGMGRVRNALVFLLCGVQHLDGMEAVTYGRIRNLQGQNDLNRNERQRKLLEALLKKVMEDMDITKFLNLIETALPYGKTNLTADELLSLGMTVLSGSAMQNLASGGEVVGQFGIPMEKQYGYREFNGESLVYISDKRMQTTLTAMQEFIYGQSYVK